MQNRVTEKESITVIFLMMLCIMWITNHGCGAKKNETQTAEYTVTPEEDFVIYGYNANKLIKMTFLDIEKEWATVTKIDSEVAVVFNEKFGHFVSKTQKTHPEDYVTATYGPIDDEAIYNTLNRKYYNLVPKRIDIYGGFLITEDSLVKESIVKELHKFMPESDTTEQIIQQIRRSFILGDYKEDLGIRINFNIPSFKVAYFSIYFRAGEISYSYLFSTTEDPYP